MKYFTLSYDDGVTQDIRLTEMLNKYNLKCTFNINSELLGKGGELIRDDVRVSHEKIKPEEVKDIYASHEVAVHTLTHPTLTQVSDDEVVRQVEQDRINLEKLVGYDIVGMAYPNGPNNDHVAEILRTKTKILYSRTVTETFNFDVQDNLYRFNPTIHHLKDTEKLFELAHEFINLKTDNKKIFYVWGHSYEFDIENTWDLFESFCKLISGRDDIIYATNREVLLGK